MNKELRPEISVVILCYKAGNFVPLFVSQVEEALEKSGINSYELVLVANYNKNEVFSDPTPSVVKDLVAKNLKLKAISKVKEGMMGWDARSGFGVASGRAIAIIDGDGQMPPADIVRVYKLLKSGNYDLVKTYREERHDGVRRLIISWTYNFFLKALFSKVRVRDVNSKPKIFTSEALQKIKPTSNDWFLDAEIIIRASYLGLRIGEVETRFYKNPNRASFIKPAAILEFIKNLVFYRLKHIRGFNEK